MSDADRFRRLFEEHRTAVFRFAARRVGVDLADEVLAETFLVAWRRLADVPPEAERRWLLTTARLVLGNISRTARRRDRLLDRIEPAAAQPDHAYRIDQSLDVHRALAELRPADQDVLRLIEWDDLSHADAAALLGCSRAALAVRLRRARARFEAALQAQDRPAPAAVTSPSPPATSLRADRAASPDSRSRAAATADSHSVEECP
jgi:RNA polymerase sigma-70 factor (ECF subfamily)